MFLFFFIAFVPPWGWGGGKSVFFLKLIYLFLAVLGLRCCPPAFSSCGERGLLFAVVHGLLTAVASLVQSKGSICAGFSSCGSWA